jgi:hypothetical protein
MTIRKRLVVLAGALVIILSLTQCAPVRVHAWERDVLAKPSMQIDANALDHAVDDHIYFSKEASSGGRGFGGGGCGCN